MKYFVIAFFLVASTTALAQESEIRISVPNNKVPEKVFYNFEEVDILGKIKKPVGGSVLQTPEIRFQKLLNLDESFIPKIIEAVDEY
ncbi:MAG: hypothetical protein KDD46_08200 [Bdellovibrionales bacterium]|nr:hypothetical protein [Bdellovibrionales bacterium]